MLTKIATMTAPDEHKRAPAVDLRLHTGQTVPLGDLYRERPVVLFFYPKDGTTICTKEACAFRDVFDLSFRRGM
jgi:peroxiredoxin Q/BCP